MPSSGGHVMMRLHMLNMCAASGQMLAIHRMRCRYAVTRRPFAMPRCGLRGLRVGCTLTRCVTMGGPLGTERVGSDWNEKDQRAADRCHDKFIHKTVSDCEAKITRDFLGAASTSSARPTSITASPDTEECTQSLPKNFNSESSTLSTQKALSNA